MRWHSSMAIMRPVRVSSTVRDRPSISFMIQGPVMLAMPALISGWPMRTSSMADADIAEQRDLKGRTGRRAVQRDDDRLRQPPQGAVEGLPFADPRLGGVFVEIVRLGEVLPGGEGPVAGAGDDHGADHPARRRSGARRRRCRRASRRSQAFSLCGLLSVISPTLSLCSTKTGCAEGGAVGIMSSSRWSASCGAAERRNRM